MLFDRVFEDNSSRGYGEQVSAVFTAPPGVQPGPVGGYFQDAGEPEAVDKWVAAVEASPAFQAGVAYQEWSFEVGVFGLW